MTLFHVCKLMAFSAYQQRAYGIMRPTAAAMEAARAYLNKFAGGAVNMETDPTSGIAIVTINNPQKRNAMSGHMMVQLYDRISELEKWAQGKAVILRGTGGNFCSGGDLDFARASGTPEGAAVINLWIRETLRRLSQLQLVSVCLAEGYTLGGGAEMSVACDFVLVADDVQYGFVHAKFGIVTMCSGGSRLVQRVGQRRALDILLTARILNASECLHLGIADEIVSKETSLVEVERWTRSRLQHDCSITRALKRIVNAASHSLEEALDVESLVCRPFWGGELNRQALAQRDRHPSETTRPVHEGAAEDV